MIGVEVEIGYSIVMRRWDTTTPRSTFPEGISELDKSPNKVLGDIDS